MAELTLHPWGEHPQIKELLSVLEQNNLQKQKEEVQALVGYMDSLEGKLAQMMEEMKEMRLEVGKLHDKGIRARCAQLVTATEGKNPADPGRWFSPPRQILFPLPGAWCRPFGEKGAPPCVKRCRLCGFPPFSPGWSAASLTLAGRGTVCREVGCDPGGIAPGGKPHEKRRTRPCRQRSTAGSGVGGR